MTTDRYQRGLDHLKEFVSERQTGTFDHAKLVNSYISKRAKAPSPSGC